MHLQKQCTQSVDTVADGPRLCR